MADNTDLGNLLGQLGGAIGSSALGNLLTKVNPNSVQQGVQGGLLSAQGTGLTTGQNLLGMGTSAVTGPVNYWSSILNGNQGQITSALAPEIQRIGQGYQAANNASAALMPRGGPRADVQANMPYQQQRDVSTLMQTARPAAAQNLASTGSNLLGQGANALYASTAAGRDVLGFQQFLQQLSAQRGTQAGQGLFSIFQQYGMPALQKILPQIFGGSGGGGGSNNPGLSLPSVNGTGGEPTGLFG